MIRTLLPVLLMVVLGQVGMFSQDRHKTQARLDKMSPEELVREYCREVPHSNRDVEERLMRNPEGTLMAIVKILDEFDPSTFKGRSMNRGFYAFWTGDLLSWIDHNHFRIRGTEEGRLVIEAYRRLMDRRKVRVQTKYKNDESEQHVYQAEFMQYEKMCGVNLIDWRIRRQLEEDCQLQLTEEELLPFSDFLVERDPGYVVWSKQGSVGKRWIFLDIEPYYQAYLDFKETEETSNIKK